MAKSDRPQDDHLPGIGFIIGVRHPGEMQVIPGMRRITRHSFHELSPIRINLSALGQGHRFQCMVPLGGQILASAGQEGIVLEDGFGGDGVG